MRVCCISDLHGQVPDDVPKCDLLLIAGDISAHTREDNELFLRRAFPKWLERQPALAIVGIAGNHDFVAQQWPSVFRSLPWTYLDNREVELDVVRQAGKPKPLKVWGSAWTPWFGPWAFMADDDQLADLWAQIPDDTDILLTHGPPSGFLDHTYDGRSAGSHSLRERVLELPSLKLHAFGHLHESHGSERTDTGTWMVNGSLMNDTYELVNRPIVIDLDM
jgi:Icc-related predicted phosphoesterase